MATEDTLEQVLARHVAFWEGADVDRPLLWMRPSRYEFSARNYVLLDGSPVPEGVAIEPSMIDMGQELAGWEYQTVGLLDGDFVGSRAPTLFSSFSWMEAILGCEIGHALGSWWAKPVEGDWTEVAHTGDWGESPWFEALLEVNERQVQIAAGRMGVAQPLFRGPFDMATAALGGEGLCLALVDRADQLAEFLDYCTNLYIDVAQRRLAETPAFRGGYLPASYFGLWAPGSTVRYQADSSYLVSPQMYRERFQRFDRRIAQAFEYPAFATHTTQARHLAVYAEIPELRVIELTLELPPYGRPPLELLPQFREVQAMGKSLLLTGDVTRAELDGLLDGLSPRGLAFRVRIREDEGWD
jgi:hypothetical protein